jgi:hypothetical protein
MAEDGRSFEQSESDMAEKLVEHADDLYVAAIGGLALAVDGTNTDQVYGDDVDNEHGKSLKLHMSKLLSTNQTVLEVTDQGEP